MSELYEQERAKAILRHIDLFKSQGLEVPEFLTELASTLDQGKPAEAAAPAPAPEPAPAPAPEPEPAASVKEPARRGRPPKAAEAKPEPAAEEADVKPAAPSRK